MSGPAPKRSDQRRRRNKTAALERSGGVTKAAGVEAVRPEPGSDWPVGITRWFESLAESGQAAFYQASDWGTAWLMADAMAKELHAEGVLKASTLSVWLKCCAALIATEGDRRRVAIELQRLAPDEEGGDNVSSIEVARRRLESRPSG